MQSLVAKPVSNPANLETTALSLTDDTLSTNLFCQKKELCISQTQILNFGVLYRHIEILQRYHSPFSLFNVVWHLSSLE